MAGLTMRTNGLSGVSVPHPPDRRPDVGKGGDPDSVLTHLNPPAMKPAPKPGMFNLTAAYSGTLVNYLQTDEVHWEGQPIAVVVAETSAAAREAAALVRAEHGDEVRGGLRGFRGRRTAATEQRWSDRPWSRRRACSALAAKRTVGRGSAVEPIT